MIEQIIQQNININQAILQDKKLLDNIKSVSDIIKDKLNQNKILYLAGNGGSAADCQHIAAELVGRFQKERKGLRAISLTTDTSIITALSNDYSYNYIFQRQIEALGKQNDILLVISTSGNSQNLINAVEIANKLKLITIGLLGKSGGQLKDICDFSLIVPSQDTPRIQEAQLMISHILCELIENDYIY